MSQTEFAEFLHTTRGAIAAYEGGQSRPKGEVESNICELFKLNREQLYKVKLTAQNITDQYIQSKPISLEKRIEKLETQIDLLTGLLRDFITAK